MIDFSGTNHKGQNMTADNTLEQTSGKYKILLVEDNAADMYLTQLKIMEIWPTCEVIPVVSIGDAYEKFKNNAFDLVILDLNLPDGFGPQSVAEVRRFNENVPIVVLTGTETDFTVSQALKLGANHVAVKSQLIDEDFKNIVQQHIKK